MRYAPAASTAAVKALTEAIAHHEHQTDQLQQTVRNFTLQLRDRGLPLDEILTELRVIFGRSIHLDGKEREATDSREAKLESLVRLATEGFRTAEPS